MNLLDFKTYTFIFFILSSLIIYYSIPGKKRWMVILAANIVFYITTGLQNFVFILFTAISTFILSYLAASINCGLKEKKASGLYTKEEFKKLKEKTLSKKRIVLITTLTLNFGILAFLKYWNAIVSSLNLTQLLAGTSKGLLLPLGISFYTFQSISYFMDVYNDKYQAEKSFFKYFTFISFFPQLIMGPINRYDNLGRQLNQINEFNLKNIKKGILLVLFGAMKKYCIADLLYGRISSVFDQHYSSLPGLLIISSILAYSIYQYADFSGGIDMVTGFANMFGLEMAPNFRQPYFATSLGDFWRRWHISLGAWMKDYVFYPFALTKRMQNLSKKLMGLNNKNLGKHLARTVPAGLGNIIVFLFVGIWHGPELHFVVWGLYNGLVIALSDLLKPCFEKINVFLRLDIKTKKFKVFQIIRTFIIVNIGWYFDRIVDVRESFIYLKQSITNIFQYQFLLNKDFLKSIYGSISTLIAELNLVFISAIIVLIVSILRENKIDVYEHIQKKNIAIRWSIYYLLIILVILSMSYAPGTKAFMYAQY